MSRSPLVSAVILAGLATAGLTLAGLSGIGGTGIASAQTVAPAPPPPFVPQPVAPVSPSQPSSPSQVSVYPNYSVAPYPAPPYQTIPYQTTPTPTQPTDQTKDFARHRQELNQQEGKLSSAQNPPTAAEQGYGQEQNQQRLKWEVEQDALNHTPQQQGLVESSPLPSGTVASSPELTGWLQNWGQALTKVGVSQEKIIFEAKRLGQPAFARWASNQLRYAPAGTPSSTCYSPSPQVIAPSNSITVLSVTPIIQ